MAVASVSVRRKPPFLMLVPFTLYALLVLLSQKRTSGSLPVVHKLQVLQENNLVEEAAEVGTRDACKGRRIYMYELPTLLNSALLEKCGKSLVSWLDFCPHLENFGFGQPINWTEQQASGSRNWSSWFGTDAYMLEVIFHWRMRSYSCLTSSPGEADAVFVAYYAGLDALRHLYSRGSVQGEQQQGRRLVEFLEEGEAWKRFSGRDHFMVMGRTTWDFGTGEGWGTGMLGLPQVENMTTLFLERNPWSKNQVAVPYPTGFHPRNAAELQEWIMRVRASKREHLFAFSGGIRPTMGDKSLRGELVRQCRASTECVHVDCGRFRCGHDPRPTVDRFLRSQFCLQPRGDTATRRSAFDALISGCIPVFFHRDSAYTQYLWHLPAISGSYSVLVEEEQVWKGGVQAVLESFSSEQVDRMRETIVQSIPGLLYAWPGADVVDAFDLSLLGVLEKVQRHKMMIM